MSMQERIISIFQKSIEAKQAFLKLNMDQLERVVTEIVNSLRGGRKAVFFGNGGSAADAQHLAAEFVNRFLYDRGALAAIALTTDSSVITSISNDYAYDQIFSRQIAALGKEGDVAIGIKSGLSGRKKALKLNNLVPGQA